MKSYIEKPIEVQAAQWDGTKESMKAIKLDLALPHNNVNYDENGEVKEWFIGTDTGTQVRPGSYIVKSVKGIEVMPEFRFEALYVENV